MQSSDPVSVRRRPSFPRLPVVPLLLVVVGLLAGAAEMGGQTPSAAPPPMSNEDVVKMAKAGVSDAVIVAAVEGARHRAFDLTPNGLIALKKSGVSDAVVLAMNRLVPAAEPAADTAAEPLSVAMNDGTIVRLQFSTSLSSEKANVDDIVRFRVAEDVIVDGHVVVKRGSSAYGRLTHVTRQLLRRSGQLGVVAESVQGVSGTQIKLRGTSSFQGTRGPLRGNEAVIESGTDFVAEVNGAVELAVPRAEPVASPAANVPRVGAAATTLPTGSGGAPVPPEIGVFVNDAGRLVEIFPEVISWRTGGLLKNLATMGLAKGHVNGFVAGPRSSKDFGLPIEFVIRCPEGTAVSEYQLLKLDQKDERREFRALTGGVFHASSGAGDDVVAFEFEKIAPSVFLVRLESVERGEYGFLPPGFSSASAVSAGRLFTFRVR